MEAARCPRFNGAQKVGTASVRRRRSTPGESWGVSLVQLEAVGPPLGPILEDFVLPCETVAQAVVDVALGRGHRLLHERVEVVELVRREGEAVEADLVAAAEGEARHVPSGRRARHVPSLAGRGGPWGEVGPVRLPRVEEPRQVKDVRHKPVSAKGPG